MNSTTSLKSNSSLLPSHQKSTSKNWETAFGKLSSSYGFGGSSAPSLPRKASKSMKSSATKSSTTFSLSFLSRSPSSVALSEKGYESSVQDSAPTPATQSRSTPPVKDYEAAFGALSAAYGFGGPVPSLPSKSSKFSKASTRAVVSSTSPSQPQLSASRPQKDYEAAFGSLSSSYGFGGGVPTLPSKK